MKSGFQIRERLLGELADSVGRPASYGGELWFRIRLVDLAFIDDCSAPLAARFEDLHAAGLWTPSGFASWFAGRIPSDGSTTEQVASQYARLAHLFGWFHPGRLHPAHDFPAMKEEAARLVRSDASAADVIAAFGAPGVVSGGVHAYAFDEAELGWLFFDYDVQRLAAGAPARADVPSSAWELRNARLPTTHWYSERIRFTPRGQMRVGRPSVAR